MDLLKYTRGKQPLLFLRGVNNSVPLKKSSRNHLLSAGRSFPEVLWESRSRLARESGVAFTKQRLCFSAADFMPTSLYSFCTPSETRISAWGNRTKWNMKSKTRSSPAQWTLSGFKSKLGWTTTLHLVLSKNHTEPPFFIHGFGLKMRFHAKLALLSEESLGRAWASVANVGSALPGAPAQPVSALLLALLSAGPGTGQSCSCGG